MTVTITGAVVVGGVRYPVETQVELPDSPAKASPNYLRLVPKAS